MATAFRDAEQYFLQELECLHMPNIFADESKNNLPRLSSDRAVPYVKSRVSNVIISKELRYILHILELALLDTNNRNALEHLTIRYAEGVVCEHREGEVLDIIPQILNFQSKSRTKTL